MDQKSKVAWDFMKLRIMRMLPNSPHLYGAQNHRVPRCVPFAHYIILKSVYCLKDLKQD